jgi:hypothetical protein
MSMRVRPPLVPPRNLAVNAPETDFQPLVTDGGSEQIKRSAVHPPCYFGLPETQYVHVLYIYIYIYIYIWVFIFYRNIYIYIYYIYSYMFILCVWVKTPSEGLRLIRGPAHRINTPASGCRVFPLSSTRKSTNGIRTVDIIRTRIPICRYIFKWYYTKW